jgi:transcriptional regulator with XRE-family HTH domain
MSDMPSASRAKALAAELRDLRRQAKLNTREAAERVGISSATLNRTELGVRMPGPEEVSAMLAAYGVTGLARERVLELTRAANPAGWWETGSDALPKQLPTLIHFESQAVRITEFQPLFLPGLLQTHAYMRAVMAACEIPDEQAEARVSARAGRQTVLSRKHAPAYFAIIDEAALRRPFGGPAVMAGQLRKVVELSGQSNITVQVIPFARGGYPLYGPFVLLEFTKQRDIVHLEHKQASGFLDDPEDTAPFRSLAATLRTVALNPGDTNDFLTAVAAEYDSR